MGFYCVSHDFLSVGHDCEMSEKSKGAVLVTAQFVILAFLVVLPHGDLWFVSDVIGTVSVTVLMVGLFIALLGIVSLGNSLTATPVPKKDAALRTTGMYTLVRHPIYSGLILIGCALMILSASFCFFLGNSALCRFDHCLVV